MLLDFPRFQDKREGQVGYSYQSAVKSSSPRLCFLRATTSPRSSSNSSATLFFLPFLPFFLSSASSAAGAVWKISGFIENRSSSEAPSLACSSSSSFSTTFFDSFLAGAGFSPTGTSTTGAVSATTGATTEASGATTASATGAASGSAGGVGSGKE